MADEHQKIKAAYFSMEISLKSDIPTYAGGLGMLAGDLLRSCADMRVPVVGVTLVYKGGGFHQVFHPDGTQTFEEVEWHKSDHLTKLPGQISLSIENEEIFIGCWRYDIVGYDGFTVPVYLLDSDLFNNELWERDLTKNLYYGESYTRLCQEIILGMGGVKMLDALGYSDIEYYHMNEGHAAFVPLALLQEHKYNDDEVRKRCVFTTHTPVAAGHDKFDYDFANQYASSYLPWHIRDIATQQKLSMSHLALNMSHYSFGVSQKHGEVARAMFPQHKIDAITNGVHHRTWVGPVMYDLYSQHIPEWIQDPGVFSQAIERIPSQAVWKYHQESKKELLAYVNRHLTSCRTKEEESTPQEESLFSPDVLTIVFARRAVPYKRPKLIYHDLDRLIRIGAGRIQLIHCGKAHPHDQFSKGVVNDILMLSKRLRGILNIVYLPDYSPSVARLLVSGCDVWLNNPVRPQEASGTSGMKAAMNGGLNFSILDGWWIEAYQHDAKAGFAIGDMPQGTTPENDDVKDVASLYSVLEEQIIPLYYHTDREEWVDRMKHAIALGAQFNTHRCINEYMEKAWVNDN